MKRPALSIIIPIYNAAPYLDNIVRPILNESFQDFELILVDDGSQDNSLAIINEYAASDGRVMVLSKSNGGPSSARNLGLSKARGTYIQFYDSDDTITPGALLTIMDTMTSTGADIVISGWQLRRIRPKSTIDMSPKQSFIDNNIIEFILLSIGRDGSLYNLWNKLFRADLIHKHGLRFQEDVSFGEDLMFAFSYFKHVKRIQIIADVTYSYLVNSESSVFRQSSIVPKYRKINDAALKDFVGRESSEKIFDLHQWVRWRWLLSYWMLVDKSNLRISEKINHIKQLRYSDLAIAKTTQYITPKMRLLEKIIHRLALHPLVALAFARILNLVKLTGIYLSAMRHRN